MVSAICGFTAKPAGHAGLRVERRVVVVDPGLGFGGLDERERERADALLGREVDRLAPAARDPERRMRLLERLRHDVAHRHRRDVDLPSQPAKGASTNIRVIASSASLHCSRLVSRSTPNAASSDSEEVSPVPNSTRPSETRSRFAMRSATRNGWLYWCGSATMPCPRRMRRVRCEQAARNTSGADEWLYSSRKWCSTSQT